VSATISPGTEVRLNDPDYGTWYGRVVVCLCKRHTWQQQVGEGGPGFECRHEPGKRPVASECPRPIHVVWPGVTESHESPDSLTVIR
jgi:hypothetical protein